MFSKFIFIFLFGYVFAEFKIWKVEEAKVSEFRRTPAPTPFYREFLFCKDLVPPKRITFQNKKWYGNHYYWDKKEKSYKIVRLGDAPTPAPVNETVCFIKDPPFSSVLDFFKNLF